jgi:two-component system, cell cycle response regulator
MRYGGEEFLAVLPGADMSELQVIGERIRLGVESTVINEMQHVLSATISLGAVAFPSTDVADIDDLVRRADAAMYVAKSTGRNRLTLAGA